MEINQVINKDALYTPEFIENIKNESIKFQFIKNEIDKIIVGQEEIIHFILLAILCKGHILLEGVPGVAKTTIIKTISEAIGLSFKRIQFTPDLLPSDLIGTLIYNQKIQDFETKRGPIFANLILADEINRAPAKVQAALLEAMQEKQVTIGSNTFALEKPYLVFATQNPVEQEGTYKLPEAQVDRFMFKLIVNYPTIKQERDIIKKVNSKYEVQQVLSKANIEQVQELVNQIYLDEKIVEYIVDIVFATRMPEQFKLPELKQFIKLGVSPRASLAIYHAAKAHAFLNKRHFVIPDDVKVVCPEILRHRITLTYEAEIEQVSADFIIKKIINAVPTP